MSLPWNKAFLEQAKSDWQAYSEINKNTVLPECHSLHYLQMATEKLAKAFLFTVDKNIDSITKTHKGFVRFLRILPQNHGLQKHFKMSGKQLQMHCESLLPIANNIEKLVPTLAQSGPNTEYPWAWQSGQLEVPSKYSYPITEQLKTPEGRRLLTLIGEIIDNSYIFFIP